MLLSGRKHHAIPIPVRLRNLDQSWVLHLRDLLGLTWEICVVFPLPVSPITTTMSLLRIDATISDAYALMGRTGTDAVVLMASY